MSTIFPNDKKKSFSKLLGTAEATLVQRLYTISSSEKTSVSLLNLVNNVWDLPSNTDLQSKNNESDTFTSA